LKDHLFQFFAVGIRAFCSLSIQKWVAYHFGTNGFTLLSHFQNLIGICIAPLADGIYKGFIQKWQHQPSVLLWATALLFTWAFCIFFGTFLFFFPSIYTQFFEKSFFHFALILLVLFFILCNQFLLAWSAALQKFLKMAFLTTFGLILSVLGVLFFGKTLEACLWAYLLGQGLAFWLSAFLLRKNIGQMLFVLKENFWQKPIFSEFGQNFSYLFRFLGVGVSIMIFSRLNTYLLREYTIFLFGLPKTGLWEAVLKISDSYTVLFHATISTVFFPKISLLFSQKTALKKYLLHIFAVIFLGALVALSILFLLRRQLLELLFSSDFLAAQSLFFGVLLGDFFKFQAYLASNLLLAGNFLKTYTFIQFLMSLVYFLAALFFIQIFGFWGLQWGFFSSYFLSYLVGIFFMIKILKKKS